MMSSIFILVSILTIQLYANSISALYPPPATPISPVRICNSTLYPSFCKTILPKKPQNVYGYGRYAVRRALSDSIKFLNLVQSYVRRERGLSTSAVGALQDCTFLATLNIDFLKNSFQTVEYSTNKTLPERQADDLQTTFSAVITNQQTCLDGLQSTASAWKLKDGLATPLDNGTKLYSVSLSLITRGWIPSNKKKYTWRGGGGRAGVGNFGMSGETRRVFERVSRRKAIESFGDNQVPVSQIVVVSQDGTGNFTTISDAVSSCPNNTDGTNGYFMVYVRSGVYEEYVSVTKNKRYLMMVGEGINNTVITGNRSVIDGWTTFNSATFAVVAPMFVAINMTFRNTAGAIKHQAVAVRNGADLSAFYSCSFEAYQDTLYTHSLRQFYKNCDVYGTVDFIFGNAAVVFQSCNLYPRLPMSGQFNAITAQGRTDPNQNTGTSIHNCIVKPADDLASSKDTVQTYLGRPWKEYSRTVYLQTYMDGFIDASGWMAWSGDFALNTSYYAEFNNSGLGAVVNDRVTWPGYHVINETDAANFTASNFLMADTWLPRMGVPYTAGLV